MPINLPLTIGASLAIPIMSHFISGEKLKKKVTTQKMLLGTVTSFFVLTVAQMAQDYYAPPIPTPTVRRATPATIGRPIMPASRVGVGNYYSEPMDEFYSGTNPYPEGHIYVD